MPIGYELTVHHWLAGRKSGSICKHINACTKHDDVIDLHSQAWQLRIWLKNGTFPIVGQIKSIWSKWPNTLFKIHGFAFFSTWQRERESRSPSRFCHQYTKVRLGDFGLHHRGIKHLANSYDVERQWMDRFTVLLWIGPFLKCTVRKKQALFTRWSEFFGVWLQQWGQSKSFIKKKRMLVLN